MLSRIRIRTFSSIPHSALLSDPYILILYDAHKRALLPAVSEDASRDSVGQYLHKISWQLKLGRKTLHLEHQALSRTKMDAKRQAYRGVVERLLREGHTPEEARATVAKTLVGTLGKDLGLKQRKRTSKSIGKLYEVFVDFGQDLQVTATGISKVSAEISAYEQIFQLFLDRKHSDHTGFLSDAAAADVLVSWNRKFGGTVEISAHPSDKGFLASCVWDRKNFQHLGPSKRIAKAHVALEILNEEISVSTRNAAAEVKRLLRAEKFDDAYRLYFDKIIPSARGFELALLEIFCACLAHDRGVQELITSLAPKSLDFAMFGQLLDAAVTSADAEIFAKLGNLPVTDTPPRLRKLRMLLALERHAQIHQARECLDSLEKFPLKIQSVDFPVIKAKRSAKSETSRFGLGTTGQMAVLETREENFLCEASETNDVVTLKVPASQSLARVRRAVAQDGTLVLLGDVETTYLRACEALTLFYQPEHSARVSAPVRDAVVDGFNRQLFSANEEQISVFAKKYNLSPAQMNALKSSQELAMTLVQGAPGAGKTHVSGAMVDLWRANGAKVLVVADSNAAVDNLRGMLKQRGIPCLRIGKISDNAGNLVNPEALDLLVGTQIYGEYMRKTKTPGSTADLWFLRRRVEMAALEAAQVVLATCVGSGNEMLEDIKFDKVLIDEATQSVEPVTLIPMTRGCDQVVLIGDHKQLPPTVVSQEAKERGLSLSLFERLTSQEQDKFSLHLLDIQRRMHPSIMEFSNELFYNNRVKTETVHRPIVQGFPWPKEDCRVCLVQTTSGSEGLSGRSRMNAREGEVVLDIIRNVVAKGLQAKDIGVIVPYNAQRLGILRQIRSSDDANVLADLAVNTVDSFQGQEKDLIIFSAVRSNSHGELGFLDDPRRINVTLTRAKRGLIVIADDQTLSRRDRGVWAQWIKWIKTRGSVIHESLVSRSYRYSSCFVFIAAVCLLRLS